ncbi:hypothetical protein [Polymorphobacter megasporae]|uniref:hypothetical protein n=1 Tax=Glacieibacterium megasporae TaxID=2835787 RepID=UPI001C1DD048|nr:hypothetical protein [Polymorphobacter megasporae]UAJ11053.1 hypothetical protein KTC28_04895 [Polymorphobacter megasporae]
MIDDLSDLAARLGRHLAEQCVDGLPGHFGDEILTEFPAENRSSIGLALAELKAAGFVVLTPLMGPSLPRILTTYELFAATDAAITGQDPTSDAALLAAMLADDPELGHVPALEARSGWTRRRLNPALGLLLPLFHSGRKRETVQNMYPTLGFLIGNDEILKLRRFAREHARR